MFYIGNRYIGYLHSISVTDICQAFSVAMCKIYARYVQRYMQDMCKDICKEAAVFTTAPELPYASDA